MDILLDPEIWVALLTLTSTRGRARHRQHRLHLDPRQQAAGGSTRQRATRRHPRRHGHAASCCCWASAGWSTLTEPLFEILGHEFSGRDLILVGGGLFLLAKATWEIHGPHGRR